MAIAHLATEYVFSDFLLKEPSEPKFKGLRLELAVDKMVTCIAVGLPLLLISLAFAQEISIGESDGRPSFWSEAFFVRGLPFPPVDPARIPTPLVSCSLLPTDPCCGLVFTSLS
uniref:Uncharacterized protein n=1 Tax=Sus scrofa TaxID=9823 RepID=A0A8D1KMZ9_PIG